MRVLFYAVNGLGLGHVTRTLAIARQVRALEPRAEILFLTSSEAEDVILREGFAAIKLPSRNARPRTGLRSGTYGRLVQIVTWNAVAAFSPNVLVVDTFPAGALHELLPVLRWEMRRVFVFRVQRPEHAQHAFMQSTLRLYDRVIVPHAEGEEEIPVPDEVEAVWVGPILIREREEALDRLEARWALGLPEDGTIVYASFGGGGDEDVSGHIRAAAAACEALTRSGPRVRLAVAAGPLFRGDRGHRGEDGVTWIENRYPMAGYLQAFDAAVSAAGYNTAAELLHMGVPTVFVPRPRQVDDQEARARRIAQAGAGLVVLDPTPESLAEALTVLLEPESARRIRAAGQALVPGSGAMRAAQAILEHK